MKKLLVAVALLLLCTVGARAQGQRVFTTVVAGADVAVSGNGIAYHLLTWNLTGAAPTCQVKLEKAAAATGPWTDLIAAAACTSNGQSAVTNGISNFVRINVTVKSGAGSVRVQWNGYTVPPSGGGSVTSITGTSPIVATPNPITGAGDVSCPTCNVSGATIGGSIASTQVAFGSGVNTIAGSANLTWVSPSFLVKSPNFGDCQALVCLSGDGAGDIDGFGTPALLDLHASGSPSLFGYRNTTLNANHYWIGNMLNTTGNLTFFGTQDNMAFMGYTFDFASKRLILDDGGGGTTTGMSAAKYWSLSNCSDAAGDAACGSASEGAVVVDATDTTTVVATTAVTATSNITVQYAPYLSTRLSVTCNAIGALPSVTAISSGTSFTITVPSAPVTNPACYVFRITN